MESGTPVSRAALLAHRFILGFVVVALLLRLGVTLFDPAAGDPGVGTRLVRLFSFFTIQSNIVVALASAAIVFGKPLDTPWWRALRLASLIGITVTGIVYVVVLSGDADNTGLAVYTNLMLHYIAPPLVVLVWLFFGPWPPIEYFDIVRALLWPAAWIVYTLVHGEISDWYPYPFIDVIEKGYGRVAGNIVGITVFTVVLGLLFTWGTRVRRGQKNNSLSSERLARESM